MAASHINISSTVRTELTRKMWLKTKQDPPVYSVSGENELKYSLRISMHIVPGPLLPTSLLNSKNYTCALKSVQCLFLTRMKVSTNNLWECSKNIIYALRHCVKFKLSDDHMTQKQLILLYLSVTLVCNAKVYPTNLLARKCCP